IFSFQLSCPTLFWIFRLLRILINFIDLIVFILRKKIPSKIQIYLFKKIDAHSVFVEIQKIIAITHCKDDFVRTMT
ncbi:MAG: hypothetical protein ABIY50_10750, partial [Ignavibacteria bacterium]